MPRYVSDLSGDFIINKSDRPDGMRGPSSPSMWGDVEVQAAPEGMGRGYVERDLEKHPVGSLFGSQGVDEFNKNVPLLSFEEIAERVEQSEKEKTRISDVRMIGDNGNPMVSLDQNGQGYCVTEDTEYLTNDGWVPVSSYDGSKAVATINPITNSMEFQFPSLVHQYEYNGEMIYSTNRRLDFGVTPNHRMYVRRWDEAKRTLSQDYSFTLAKDIGWYSGLLSAPTEQIGTHIEDLAVPGHAAFSGDDFFALLGLIVSDGFAGGVAKNQNVVSFASFRNDPAVIDLAVRCGFRKKDSNEAVWICTSHEFANWIRENCYCSSELGAANKCVPLLVKAATPRQIRIFLKFFDDRNRDGSQFYSGSKKLIDDLQELHMRIGVRSSIGKREPRSVTFAGNKDGQIHSKLPLYVLTVSSNDRLCIDKKKHIEQDRYKGMVYCVTVPNGTLVTRRNGSVLYSGNCWAYSTCQGMMIRRAQMGLPYIRLSAHSLACKVKGFRDEGGWCGLSATNAMTMGYVPVKYWSEKSMNRSLDNQANWEIAKGFRITEGFMDLQQPVYGKTLTFQQVLSCAVSGIPVAVDYNHWSHSILGMDPVLVTDRFALNDPRTWGLRIWNSWRDQWGKLGTGVLLGQKAIPNGAVGIRDVTYTEQA